MVGFASLNPPYEGSLPAHKEGSGTPADAIFVPRTQRRAGRATERAACAAPPLSGALACRRSTTALAKGTRHPQGSASGQASWDVAKRVKRSHASLSKLTGVTRLRLSQPSGAPHTPVLVPGG